MFIDYEISDKWEEISNRNVKIFKKYKHHKLINNIINHRYTKRNITI